MDYDAIEKTVRKHLEYHDSLCLTKHRKSGNLFFYNIPSKEIDRLLSKVNISSSIVSRCDFDCNWDENKANYLCVKMVRNEPDNVELYFYSFDRIRITFLKRSKRAELKTGRLLFKMAINEANNQFYWFDSVHNYHPLRFYYDLNMIRETGDRLKLSFHSASQFVRFHDLTLKEYMKKKKAENLEQDIVKLNSRFEALRELLPPEFEWINTTDRLYEEGEKQHNCVFSYRSRIVDDECAVYHWETEGREYTIEFTVSSRGVFRVKQMMQKYNFPFLEADARKVNDYLAGCNNAVLIH